MLPAEHYIDARRNAAFHGQFEVLAVPQVARTPCLVPVRAKVSQVYRSRLALAVGDEIDLPIPVTRPGDTIPASGTIWKAYDVLRRTPFLEAYLNVAVNGYELALSQVEFLDKSTGNPRFSLE